MTEKNGRMSKVLYVCMTALLIIFWTVLLIYLRKHITAFLDSDDASEMILSRLLAREGRFITPNWYYSTELRVLNTQIVYSFFFRFFDNWHRVRIWSLAVMQALLIIAVSYLCRACRFKKAFPFAALALVLPFSEDYFYFVLKGAYYLPNITSAILGMGLILRYAGKKDKRAWLRLLLSFLLALLNGMGGARALVMFYMPLVLCGVFLLLSEKGQLRKRIGEFSCVRFYSVALVSSAGAAAGYLLNNTVLAGHYHFMHWGNNVSFIEPDGNSLVRILNGFLSSFGFRTGNFSMQVILSNGIALMMLILTAAAVVYGIRSREACAEYRILSLFFASAILVFSVLYMLTDMQYRDRYNLPVLFFACFLIMLWIRDNSWNRSVKHAAVLSFVFMIITGGCLVYRSLPSDSEEMNEKLMLTAFLTEQDYSYGYATFWNANILTELSDGKIEMHTWWDSTYHPEGMEQIQNVNQTYRWLQEVAHDSEKPKGKVFLLFTNEELDYSFWKENLTEEYEVIRTPSYAVYGFDSYDGMISRIGDYRFSFEDGRWLDQGKDQNGKRLLFAKGTSRGPCIPFYKGAYTVIVKGRNLQDISVSCACGDGKTELPVELETHSSDEITFAFMCDADYEKGEIILRNTAGSTAEISEIYIDAAGNEPDSDV